jgi:putative membrane protein
MMGGGMHGFGGMGGLGNFGWPGMILGLLFNIGVIVAVVWLIVWLAKHFTSSDLGRRDPFGASGGNPGPREILQARYARGEITREKFHEMLADINS